MINYLISNLLEGIYKQHPLKARIILLLPKLITYFPVDNARVIYQKIRTTVLYILIGFNILY
jgi:hypothetical protein